MRLTIILNNIFEIHLAWNVHTKYKISIPRDIYNDKQ